MMHCFMPITTTIAPLFLLFLVPCILCSDNSNNIVLTSTVVQCSNDDALTVGSPKHPIRLASTFKGHAHFDLKLYSKCRKKLWITLKVADTTAEFRSNGIVLLNHGQNSLTHKSSYFRLPVAIKYQLGKIFQKYHLKHLYKVNGKMMEEVMNLEHNKTYHGCDNSEHAAYPTCGYYPGTEKKPAGFCCSCKDHRNNVQQRGGHRCDVPGKSAEQLTSAHCLRPSPFHYDVFEIEHPTLYQRLSFEVFRSELVNGTNDSLTWHRMSAYPHGVHVDTYNTMGASGEVKVSYHPHLSSIAHSATIFDPISQRLLAPAQSPIQDPKEVPEPFKGILPSQMLIVPNNLMTNHGAQCDLVGSGIKAFLNQTDACRQERHSCLKMQPFDLWKMDQGIHSPPNVKFKLSSFRSTEKDLPPFADIQEENNVGFLYAEHKTTTPTKVYIEVPADNIMILAPGYNAYIESVITDTRLNGSVIVSNIVNKEYVAAPFAVELADCSFEIFGIQNTGASKVGSPSQKLEGREARNFTVEIKSSDISQTVYCFLLLINEYGESIAAREITFHPNETCRCIHTCKCMCGAAPKLSKCERLDDENIIAAGLYLEVKTPEQLAEEEKLLSENKMNTIIRWALIVHGILLALGLGIWTHQKCFSPKEKARDEIHDDYLSYAGSDEGEEEEEEDDDEEETDYDTEVTMASSARSVTDDSDVTLYKKGAPSRASQKKSTKGSVPELASSAPSRGNIPASGTTSNMGSSTGAGPGSRKGSLTGAGPGSRKGSLTGAGPGSRKGSKTSDEIPLTRASVTSDGPVNHRRSVEDALGIPQKSKDPYLVLPQEPESIHKTPSFTNMTTLGETDHSVVSLHDHDEPEEEQIDQPFLPDNTNQPNDNDTIAPGGGEAVVRFRDTPSKNWNSLNNNESKTENDIESFLGFCATASSSRTSFGTYTRRKREQYSAYDFLPEPKQRNSVTWGHQSVIP